ncbi:MAG: poly-beta-1,6-N-acetyl-D-glucosamine N-deacetylase PgaB, partial [Thermodesulfobacteriota bacterium]
AARESNPNLQFAINLYFEAVINDSKGMVWFSQTLSEALEKDFDYYAVMAYHRQAMKDLKIELKEAIDRMGEATRKAVEAVGDPSRVLMKVWVLDWGKREVLPKEEMEEILTVILNRGEVSLAFVPYVDRFPIHSLKEKWVSSK